MKESTKKLFAKIDEAHDWQEGEVYGGGGTSLNWTDVCHVCSLRRHVHKPSASGTRYDTRFSDGETGNDLSLRQAVKRGCAGID